MSSSFIIHNFRSILHTWNVISEIMKIGKEINNVKNFISMNFISTIPSIWIIVTRKNIFCISKLLSSIKNSYISSFDYASNKSNQNSNFLFYNKKPWFHEYFIISLSCFEDLKSFLCHDSSILKRSSTLFM